MGEAVIISRTLKTWGLSEARIDQMVEQYMSLPNPTLALYAKPDGIHLRITAKSSTRAEALQLIESREKEIRQILGTHIWGTDAETLEEIISRLLINGGFTIGVAETFTGGMLSQAFSSAPGCAKFFKGGIVINRFYTRNSPYEQIAVSASPENSLRLAEIACKQLDADIGIGIDGGAASGEQSQFALAFIAIHRRKSGKDIQQTYQWRPEMLARRAVTGTLLLLRKFLIE
jgi:nicotinamide-nucleotide amidase